MAPKDPPHDPSQNIRPLSTKTMRRLALLFFSLHLFSAQTPPPPNITKLKEIIRCDIKITDTEIPESGSLRIYREGENPDFIAEIHHLGPDAEGLLKEVSWGTATEIIHDLRFVDDQTHEVLKALSEINDIPWNRVAIMHVIRINPILDGSLATLYVYKNDNGDIIRKTATLGFMPLPCSRDAFYDPHGADILEMIEEFI